MKTNVPKQKQTNVPKQKMKQTKTNAPKILTWIQKILWKKARCCGSIKSLKFYCPYKAGWEEDILMPFYYRILVWLNNRWVLKIDKVK